jgi:hypothetical protein
MAPPVCVIVVLFSQSPRSVRLLPAALTFTGKLNE